MMLATSVHDGSDLGGLPWIPSSQFPRTSVGACGGETNEGCETSGTSSVKRGEMRRSECYTDTCP